MTREDPVTELDRRFSSDGASATSWDEGRDRLEKAEVYWLSTVRPDGRPHVTPMIAVWLKGSLYFCTGADERKAKNLEGNRRCVVTTGSDSLGAGLDVVLEGEAVRVGDEERLQRIADAYLAKYGRDWVFDVQDAGFVHNDGGRALVFEVSPSIVFGFAKGTYGQTRWRFS